MPKTVRLLHISPPKSFRTIYAVYAYDKAPAYEVEFANPEGKPRFLVVTVEAADLLKLQPKKED